MRFAGKLYLDDGDDVGCRSLKLAHVDIEVLELVFLGLRQHEIRTVSDGMNTAKVCGRV